jgi:hypothetical protein
MVTVTKVATILRGLAKESAQTKPSEKQESKGRTKKEGERMPERAQSPFQMLLWHASHPIAPNSTALSPDREKMERR